MMKLSVPPVVLSLGILLAATGTSLGQQRVRTHGPHDVGSPAVAAGPNYHHASTALQGYLDARSRLLRSLGQTRYNNALASRHEQAAREQALRNSILHVDAYFERIRRNQAHRRALRRPRRTVSVASTKKKVVSRASSDELNPETGAITWPYPLRAATFAPHRRTLEVLFSQRRYGETGVGTQNYEEVKTAISAMRAVLAQCIRQRDLDYDEYTVSRQFLERLNNEARM